MNPQAGYIAYGAATSSQTFVYEWELTGTDDKNVTTEVTPRESEFHVSWEIWRHVLIY